MLFPMPSNFRHPTKPLRSWLRMRIGMYASTSLIRGQGLPQKTNVNYFRNFKSYQHVQPTVKAHQDLGSPLLRILSACSKEPFRLKVKTVTEVALSFAFPTARIIYSAEVNEYYQILKSPLIFSLLKVGCCIPLVSTGTALYI